MAVTAPGDPRSLICVAFEAALMPGCAGAPAAALFEDAAAWRLAGEAKDRERLDSAGPGTVEIVVHCTANDLRLRHVLGSGVCLRIDALGAHIAAEKMSAFHLDG